MCARACLGSGTMCRSTARDEKWDFFFDSRVACGARERNFYNTTVTLWSCSVRNTSWHDTKSGNFFSIARGALRAEEKLFEHYGQSADYLMRGLAVSGTHYRQRLRVIAVLKVESSVPAPQYLAGLSTLFF